MLPKAAGLPNEATLNYVHANDMRSMMGRLHVDGIIPERFGLAYNTTSKRSCLENVLYFVEQIRGQQILW